MKDKIVIKRYAEAFLSFAKSNIGLEKAIEELRDLKLLISAHPEFDEFLCYPEIALKEKIHVIDKVLVNFSKELKEFLKLLIDKRRIEYLIEMCDYVRIKYSHGEAIEAVLRSSYPLDLDLLQEIKTKLEKKLGRKLNLFLDLDPDLLGGIQIRIGNVLIDGSVRRRLDELKEKLMTVQVV